MAAPGLEAGAIGITSEAESDIALLAGQPLSSVYVAQIMETNPAWPMISRLSVTLAARIPMESFRVRDLLTLAEGQTIPTAWPATEDVPLLAGELQVGWSEFEVIGRRMALRLTRLV